MFNYISTCVGPSVRPELGILGRLSWTSTDCKAENLKVQTIMQSGVVNKLTKKSNAIWSWAGAQIFSLLVLGSWWVPHVNLVGIVGKQGSRQAWTRKRLYPEMPAEEFVIAAFLFHFGNLRFYFLYLRWSPSSGSNKIQYLATKFAIVRKIKMSVPIVSHVY